MLHGGELEKSPLNPLRIEDAERVCPEDIEICVMLLVVKGLRLSVATGSLDTEWRNERRTLER